MTTDDELTRLGEPPATPEEEAAALRLDELLEQRRHGAGAAQAAPVEGRVEPEVEKTINLIDEHVRHAAACDEARELDELVRIFPKYEPLLYLGGGGMGVVYLMRHVMLDCHVAVKVIRHEAAEEPQFIDRFCREARAMAMLDHPRIARVMDFGKAEDRYYLETQYMNGGSLRDKLREGPLLPEQALAIARDICEALQHAHGRNVTHRDISPDNILFDRADNLKVADFGLARVWGDDYLTRSDQRMGKGPYMAPEQRNSAKTADGRADLYSVGVVLYEMLTGERPEVGYTRASQKVKVHPVHPEVDTIISRALEPDPERRFQNAEEMKVRIERVQELPLIPDNPEPPPPPPPWYVRVGKGSKRYRAAAAVALILAVVGLLAWKAFRPAPREEEVLLWGGDPSGGAPFVWEEPGEHSKLKGFEVEMMEQLRARLHVRTQFVPVSWDMLPQALKRGDIHVIFNGYGWNPQRGREMNATLPYAVLPTRLIVRKGEQKIRDWNDLSRPPPGGKWHVGTLRTSSSEKYLKDRFPDTVEVEAPADGTTGVLLALDKGRLDAAAQDEFTTGYYLRNDFPGLEPVGAPQVPDPVVAYVAHDNPALRDRINDALKDMKRDGTLKKIYQAYGVWNEDEENLEDLWRDWPPRDEPASVGLGRYAWLLLRAAGVTVLLACIAMPLAMLLGLLVALGRMYGPRWLGLLLTAYVEFLRGTPLLLQLFVIYYLLPEVGIYLPAFWAGVIGLAVNYSAYESEHYRAGLLAVPRGQLEAALTLGMSKWTALWRIVLPQALRIVVPSSTNDFIALFKDTAICSVIAVVELTGQYERLLVDQPGNIVTFAVMAGLLYLLMSYPLALLSRRLERRPQPVAA
jgi:polar amino acid transport system substrate-binding protein